ncbi:MAG: chromosomal replication initiator protein DnaA, partial [Syntrophales bacterium LBB04]|nr:chromosomal replication initiator protein DnaA [Syntrophales bacterium LBB04]
MEPLFNRLLAKLKEELQPEDFKRWISPLGCHYPAEGQLTILAPNIFFKNWVTDNYLPLIKKALEDLSGRSIALDI